MGIINTISNTVTVTGYTIYTLVVTLRLVTVTVTGCYAVTFVAKTRRFCVTEMLSLLQMIPQKCYGTVVTVLRNCYVEPKGVRND